MRLEFAMNKLIGIPANGPKLSDDISQHFGHCKYFVIVEIKDGNQYQKKSAIQNKGHSGCMEPVLNMNKRKVTDMIVGGIGGRPYMGFQRVGINIFQGEDASIEKNVEELIKGNLKKMGKPSCSGKNNQ
ncbi:MAG: NifB/NifX family molybdenum-iron cluster-binding protein [Promethearchaeia archaeon]